MGFTPRLTRPEAGNKYYITKSAGGYSDAVKGNPTDPACNVLHNCVVYAYGRFNEIVGEGACKYLRPVNAENFIQYRGSLEVGMEPRLGACMVWQKGATLTGSDGAGHVAIVEKIVSSTEIVTSESGYGASKPFWTQTRKKGDGNWGQKSGYKFLGFIYNPAKCCRETTKEVCTVDLKVLKKGAKGEDVRALQYLLIGNGCSVGASGADGSFGAATDTAVRSYQKANGLTVDGSCGGKTWAKLLGQG